MLCSPASSRQAAHVPGGRPTTDVPAPVRLTAVSCLPSQENRSATAPQRDSRLGPASGGRRIIVSQITSVEPKA
jgi:hypothetical protein